MKVSQKEVTTKEEVSKKSPGDKRFIPKSQLFKGQLWRAREKGHKTLMPACLGSNPNSTTYEFCDLDKWPHLYATQPLPQISHLWNRNDISIYLAGSGGEMNWLIPVSPSEQCWAQSTCLVSVSPYYLYNIGERSSWVELCHHGPKVEAKGTYLLCTHTCAGISRSSRRDSETIHSRGASSTFMVAQWEQLLTARKLCSAPSKCHMGPL